MCGVLTRLSFLTLRRDQLELLNCSSFLTLNRAILAAPGFAPQRIRPHASMRLPWTSRLRPDCQLVPLTLSVYPFF
jgi:hypothetical protein